MAKTSALNDPIYRHRWQERKEHEKGVAEIEAAEKEKMREKCMKIINHNINCFIDRQLIYNFPEEIFADHGVMAIGGCSCSIHVLGRNLKRLRKESFAIGGYSFSVCLLN
eukprot:1146374-Pelagomonas_calceolata.AAC.3